jgi:hypothetical protein
MSTVNYKLGTSLSLLVTVDTTTGWNFTGSTIYLDIFDYKQINATTRGTPLFTKSWSVHQSPTETLLTLSPTELTLQPKKYIASLRIEHSPTNKKIQDFVFEVVNFEIQNCGNSCNVILKNVDCKLVFKIVGAIVNQLGSGGEDKHYEQIFTNVNSVTLDHNLAKYPAITTIDSAGTQFITDVNHVTINQTIISWNGVTSGIAYAN